MKNSFFLSQIFLVGTGVLILVVLISLLLKKVDFLEYIDPAIVILLVLAFIFRLIFEIKRKDD